MFPVKRVFCSTDFSVPSSTGVKAANELALNQSAEIILISVVETAYQVWAPGVPRSYAVTEYYKEMERDSKRNLAKVEEEQISPEINSKRIVVRGNPADEIVNHAKKENADVIVIATHGWSGWRRFVFGSVAEKVLRSADRPVLAIPEPTG